VLFTLRFARLSAFTGERSEVGVDPDHATTGRTSGMEFGERGIAVTASVGTCGEYNFEVARPAVSHADRKEAKAWMRSSL
jgi:hypothetical protein